MDVRFTDEEVVDNDERNLLQRIPLQAYFLSFVTVDSAHRLVDMLPSDLLGVAINGGFMAFGLGSLFRMAKEGFGGESALDTRMGVRKLECSGGSFVAAQGVVEVGPLSGAWTAAPTGKCGQRVLRFYLDFPKEVQRNDVTIPAGRVFFSTVCWDAGDEAVEERRPVENQLRDVEAQLDAMTGELQKAADERLNRDNAGGPLEGAKTLNEDRQLTSDARKLLIQLQELRGALPDDGFCVTGPGGVQVVKEGGLVIKRNDWRNGFGALGDVFLILGRFNVAPPKD